MSSIYVGGPVVRPGAGQLIQPWAFEVYRLVTHLASQQGADVMLPESELRMEHMEPADFYRETQSRIAAASVGIMVFASPDASAAVEASMLAVARKPQLIVAERFVPRLIRGLPHVKGVADAEQALRGDVIRGFLVENLRSGGAAMAY